MIRINGKKCLKCAGCVGICPVNALTLKDEIKCSEDCTDCGICVDFCPVAAISLESE
ncbi:MAG: 4Fe-4S binding protein [Candidatus Aenigmarchaeota archaeon]|nr:4Fe-4S binding protein [Candidatus Aenigmarchaeota archaeon]